jgi:hypothetical protein
MRKIFLITVSIMLVCESISAQTFSFPELSGFKKVSNYPVFKPENLWDFINGAADTYLALGFVDLNVVEYKKGKNVIKLEVYKHSDNTMAFGIYASERSPSFRYLNLGAQGYIADGAINFFKGDSYVKIRTYSKSPKILQAAESLASRVSEMIQGDTEMPDVLSKFPETGKRPNEETYINESVLGHKFLNKGFKAEYTVGPDNFSVYIMISNSPEETWKTAEAYLSSVEIEASESESGKFMLADGYNGTIFLAWKEKLLVIISGLSKDQTDLADKYSSEILK